MMWGSWAVLDNPPQEIDRRERSRIVVPDACAILYSAPIFDLGAGNPFESEQEKSALQERLVQLGDPGDITEEAFNNNPQRSQHQPILNLDSLSNKLEQLAATTGTKRKTELIIELRHLL